MLVPVQGGVTNLQKRNRTIHQHRAMMKRVAIPKLYLYNVGPKEWKGVGGGREWTIPACEPGERYSKPVPIDELVISERDLADGGNNLDTITDSALSGVMEIGGDEQVVPGVIDDIIGYNSTTPLLDINTTNGAWFGVFWSRNLNEDEQPEPLEEEIDQAEDKLRQMAKLIYDTGAEAVQTGAKVAMMDRRRYNWAATFLGLKQLWGNLDHTLDQCPECGEDIRKGARLCKHCGLAIDQASVEARRVSREREAEKILGEQKPAAPIAAAAQGARGSAKKKRVNQSQAFGE